MPRYNIQRFISIHSVFFQRRYSFVVTEPAKRCQQNPTEKANRVLHSGRMRSLNPTSNQGYTVLTALYTYIFLSFKLNLNLNLLFFIFAPGKVYIR